MGIANAARIAYDLAFQVSPIILMGGNYPSGMPIIGLLGQLPGIGNFPGQLVSLGQGIATNGLSADDFFAKFLPLPGSTLINNTIGRYPFANQQVAANAIIQQPLNISLHMIAPVKDEGGYLTKLAIFTSLQNALQSHCSAGGTFNIATPSFIYTNCLMTLMQDITSGTTNQKQIEYQLDFEQPLITQAQATAALNTLMGKLAGSQQVTSSNWWGQFSNIPGTNGMPANIQKFNTPFSAGTGS
jgi:hypothetical protein